MYPVLMSLLLLALKSAAVRIAAASAASVQLPCWLQGDEGL